MQDTGGVICIDDLREHGTTSSQERVEFYVALSFLSFYIPIPRI